MLSVAGGALRAGKKHGRAFCLQRKLFTEGGAAPVSVAHRCSAGHPPHRSGVHGEVVAVVFVSSQDMARSVSIHSFDTVYCPGLCSFDTVYYVGLLFFFSCFFLVD